MSGLVSAHSSFWDVNPLRFFLNPSLDNAPSTPSPPSPLWADASQISISSSHLPAELSPVSWPAYLVIASGCLKGTSNAMCPKRHSGSLPPNLAVSSQFHEPKMKGSCLMSSSPSVSSLSPSPVDFSLLKSSNWPPLYVCTKTPSFHISLYSWHNLLTGLPVIHTASSLSTHPPEQPRSSLSGITSHIPTPTCFSHRSYPRFWPTHTDLDFFKVFRLLILSVKLLHCSYEILHGLLPEYFPSIILDHSRLIPCAPATLAAVAMLCSATDLSWDHPSLTSLPTCSLPSSP